MEPRATEIDGTPGRTRDRCPQALQGVTAGLPCDGCGRPFTPVRSNQRHCRPSCRVAALRRRRRSDQAPEADGDQLARGLFE